MCHSLRNLEHHHFKFEAHRRPCDVHVHFFGTDCLSFGAGIALQDGDVMEVAFEGFGRPLRNPVHVATSTSSANRSQFVRIRAMSKPRVAILGLGIMGGGMATRLLSSGFPVSVYNRNREKAKNFGGTRRVRREYTTRGCREIRDRHQHGRGRRGFPKRMAWGGRRFSRSRPPDRCCSNPARCRSTG